MLDPELRRNANVVGNAPNGKNLESNRGWIKDGVTVHVNMGWNVNKVLIP